jgi:DnaJ-domain-containing protein 1
MDYFALLGQPRQPWLDPASLKAAFLEQSARLHPDRAQGASAEEKTAATGRFAELNAAYNCLREPKERLLHLLELESGAPAANVQSIPQDSMDLFMETGQACRQVDSFIAAKARASSPLLQVQRLVRSHEWTVRLQELHSRIHTRRRQLVAELQEMNAAWNAAPPVPSSARAKVLPLHRLEEMARTLSYVARCLGQLQDRLSQLVISQ